MAKAIIGLIVAALLGSAILVKVVIFDVDMSWVKEWVKGPKTIQVYHGDCLLILDRDTGKTLNKECTAQTYQEKNQRTQEKSRGEVSAKSVYRFGSKYDLRNLALKAFEEYPKLKQKLEDAKNSPAGTITIFNLEGLWKVEDENGQSLTITAMSWNFSKRIELISTAVVFFTQVNGRELSAGIFSFSVPMHE